MPEPALGQISVHGARIKIEKLVSFFLKHIKDLCEKLHKDFVSKFKFARVWGESAKFPGQKLMLGHTLHDGDVVEVHLS